jgi:hypothetical protein
MLRMLRTAGLAALLVTLAACATAPASVERVALVKKPAVADDLECMASCLEDGVEDCESCADQCLERVHASGVLAAFKP